jgi:RNA polymerase sigma-70 factor (sigma-E family)
MGGDDDFDTFATTAWPRLRRSAYLITGDDHLADDLAQTALERTYSHWSRVRHQEALAYARRTLVNLNVDRLRRRRGVVEVSDAVLATVPARDPERLVVEDRDELVRLLAGLTDRERRVVVLRHYFDLSESQTAEELGIAPGTVKSTLARALTKLRVQPDHRPEEDR